MGLQFMNWPGIRCENFITSILASLAQRRQILSFDPPFDVQRSELFSALRTTELWNFWEQRKAKKSQLPIFFGLHRLSKFFPSTQSSASFPLNSALELKNNTFEKQKRSGAPLRGPEVALILCSLKWKKSRFWQIESWKVPEEWEQPLESAKSWNCFDQDSPVPEMRPNCNKYEGQGSFTQLCLSGSNKRYLYRASKHVARLHCHLQLYFPSLLYYKYGRIPARYLFLY